MAIIVADTTCGLPRKLLAERHIPLIPQIVTFGEESYRGGEDAHLCVIQVEAEREAQALVEMLKSKVAVSDIPIYELPPAIVVHAGPKAMGVGFFL